MNCVEVRLDLVRRRDGRGMGDGWKGDGTGVGEGWKVDGRLLDDKVEDE